MDDDGSPLGPALERAVLHENDGLPATTPCELDLALVRGGKVIEGRFPFVFDRL